MGEVLGATRPKADGGAGVRALVVAAGRSEALQRTGERRPGCLLPLMDRPFLQHLLDYLAQQGVRRVDLLLNRRPEMVEALVEDGRRWGLACAHHLVRDPARPFAQARAITRTWGGPWLLAAGDRLPRADLAALRPEPGAPPLLLDRTGSPGGWSGWAWLGPGDLEDIPREADEDALAAHLAGLGAARRAVPAVLGCRDFGELWRAHRAVLGGDFPGLMLSGRQVEPGIWLGRNVTLHPTAQLEPPVYVGPDCRIQQGVVLGPWAVLGAGCLVDRHASVEESLIFPDSYVGQELELSQAVVDRNRLVSLRLEAALEVPDDFLLGSMKGRRLGRALARAGGRLAALALLAAGAPFLLALVLARRAAGRPGLSVRRVVRLPAPRQEARWRDYGLWSLGPGPRPRPERGLADLVERFLPGLVNVARGDLSLVGLAPMDRAALAALPPERLGLRRHAKAGLVDEASVVFGPTPDPDELYSAEAFYTAVAGPRQDLTVLGRYLGRVLGALGPRRRTLP